MSDTTTLPLRHALVPDTAVGTKFCDTVEIDQEAHRLYAGDNWAGGVDVFDIATPEARYLKTIRTKGGFYGIAVAKDLNKVFVGLAAGTVGVIDIDPASPTVDTFVARTEFGARSSADLIEYVPEHRKVYAGMHGDRYVGVLDAVTHAVVARIEGLGGNLEQPRYYPGDGMVYVASRTANALHQIDPTTDTLVQTFDIGVDCHPNGVAINPNTGMALLVAAKNQLTVVWDLRAQKIASVIEETGGGDGAFYDPTVDRFFAAHEEFAGGPVIGIFSGDPVRFLTNVPTQRGASWVAYDRTNRLVYAPAIEAGRPALISFPLPV
jgi:DNA-binding beta-propeller fold protein YncE